MSAAATAPPTTPEPSRAGRLLNLLRRLIEYGKELAATIRKRAVTDPASTRVCFGTTDLALILACINRGLNRANELEARVLRGAAWLDAKPAPANSRWERKAPAARPSDEADPRLVSLPSPARIAAEVRRRPIGAVIADICRDLGILPCHPLWRELQFAIIEYNGNHAGLTKDILDRAFSPPVPHASVGAPAVLRRPALRYEAPSCTGPP
jgi:hypothetical protein